MSIIKITKGGVLSLVLGKIKRNICIRNYLRIVCVLFMEIEIIYLFRHFLKENKDEEEGIK
jgi:hypothetical protein